MSTFTNQGSFLFAVDDDGKGIRFEKTGIQITDNNGYVFVNGAPFLASLVTSPANSSATDLADKLAAICGTELSATDDIIEVVGVKDDLDGTPADITTWGALNFDEAAEIIDVISNSAADGAAGANVQSVIIRGIGAANEDQSETVVLSASSTAVTVNTYKFINDVRIATHGANGVAAGNIEFDNQSGNRLAQIDANNTRSFGSGFVVPANKEAIISDGVIMGGTEATGNDILIRSFKRPSGGVFTAFNQGGVVSGGTIVFNSKYILSAGGAIKYNGIKLGANTITSSLSYSVKLIDA